MTYAQIIERRNTMLAEAGRLAQGKTDAETRQKIQGILQEADTLKQDADIAKALEDHQNELRSAGRPPRGEVGAGEQSHEKRALVEWMRSGNMDRTVLSERRDLTAYVASTPGVQTSTITSSVLLPVGMDQLIHSARKTIGGLANAVRQLQTASGEPNKVSFDDDTQNSLVTLATETTAVTEVDPALSGTISYVDDLTTGVVRISRTQLADSFFNLDEWIAEKFVTRVQRGLSKAVALGNGQNIASINTAATSAVTTASGTAIAMDEVTALYSALNPDLIDSASWVMSPAVKAYLLTLKDGYGRSYLAPDPTTGEPGKMLYGRPVVSNASGSGVSAGAGNAILFGSVADAYTLRTVAQGLEIIRLVERYAEFNEVGFIGRLRAGGYATVANPSVATAPLLALTMHS